jgi:hypothetical protein
MSDDPSERGSAMEGGGFYNRHSAMQATGAAALHALWEDACRRVDIEQGPVTIVDFGSSQGRNSMIPMRIAIDGLRERLGPSVPIEIVHTDLPSNDYTALFEALALDPNSYMIGTSGVSPFAMADRISHNCSLHNACIWAGRPRPCSG